MVLGVCRRVVGHLHDAEDAFQVVFLVLARKAAAVVPRDRVGNWLYGVAYQTARKARARVLRRRAREKQVTPLPEPAAPDDGGWDDLRPLLDRELIGLPSRYRAPVILCDLEGKTRKEAARLLGWPEGTLSGRLARARTLLARRLARRGLTLAAPALAALIAENAAATVPAGLTAAAARVAVSAGTGMTVGGVLSTLVKGGLETMLLNKAPLAVVLVLAITLAGLATHALNRPALAEGQAPVKVEAPAQPTGLRQAIESFPWVLTGVNPAKGTIGVRMLSASNALSADDLVFHQLKEMNTWQTTSVALMPAGSRLAIEELPLAKEAKVFLDGKPAALVELKMGMRLALKLAAGEPAVARLDARPLPTGNEVILKRIDPDAKMITVVLADKELTLAVAPDVQIFSNAVGRTGSLKDLEAGMSLCLTLGVDKDRLVVKRILAKKEGI
jgi:RNA polymerase sigma factor (sigma-70 family)